MTEPSPFAKTPAPPYYAVVFTSQRKGDAESYNEMALKMYELAMRQPGFLGVEGAYEDSGFGITVSYGDSEQSIANWKANLDHLAAQRLGKAQWYEHYELRVAKVERAYCARSSTLHDATATPATP